MNGNRYILAIQNDWTKCDKCRKPASWRFESDRRSRSGNVKRVTNGVYCSKCITGIATRYPDAIGAKHLKAGVQ